MHAPILCPHTLQTLRLPLLQGEGEGEEEGEGEGEGEVPVALPRLPLPLLPKLDMKTLLLQKMNLVSLKAFVFLHVCADVCLPWHLFFLVCLGW